MGSTFKEKANLLLVLESRCPWNLLLSFEAKGVVGKMITAPKAKLRTNVRHWDRRMKG